MKTPLFISTSIPYVNAKPHVGHALEFVEADVLARVARLTQGRGEVFLLSGTDDNALKNVQAAEAAGLPVSEYVASHAELFRILASRLEISLDDFLSTSSDERHARGAQKLWSACRKEDIYTKTYRGLYCVGCEEFKTEKDLINGECPEHPGKKLEEVEEENYFFKLTNYTEMLREAITGGKLRIVPDSRKNEMLAFIDSGLEDFSISRSVARARGWGVSVPGDDSQVMYVWFDALANYITALGYAADAPLFERFWRGAGERLHVVGKGITRFHALYWPAMLASAGLPLPTTIFVHGYITVGGQKMSKSIGNVIDPVKLLDEYGADALRYVLLRHAHPFEDGDLTEEKIKEAYNANLANGLGNLASRLLRLSSTHLPEAPKGFDEALPDSFLHLLEQFEFQKASDYVWNEIGSLDARIQETEVFKLVKSDPEAGKKLVEDMLLKLYTISRMLEPLLPATSSTLGALIKENKMPEAPLFPRKD